MTMHAAVVRSFDRPPAYEEHDEPTATGPNEVVADVLAAGLHPRVRSGAAGRHYTSTGRLPLIPGIDGVARLPDGARAYFVVSGEGWGSMADRAVVDTRRALVLPDGADIHAVAAGMNPAMSSWVALRHRVPMRSGQSVLVVGATGSAGGMAVQVARLLGAGRVIGVGRNREQLARLTGLGADVVVALVDDPDETSAAVAREAADIDIVIDYLWGEPSALVMGAVLQARRDRSRPLDWVQIGAVAGPTLALESAALRSANLRVLGVGQGSVPARQYLAALPSLVDEITAGHIRVRPRPVALSEVETAWLAGDEPGERTVLIPDR